MTKPDTETPTQRDACLRDRIRFRGVMWYALMYFLVPLAIFFL